MKQYTILILMVLGAAFSRLIPHPWNFTAVAAMALFGATYFPAKKYSVILPLLALFISDLVLGFHSTMFFVYGAFALVGILGWTLRDQRSPSRVVLSSLCASVLFFVISNFGVWFMDRMYTQDLQGLITCYVAALPFFDNQVFGDLFFTTTLFSTYELIKKYVLDLHVSA